MPRIMLRVPIILIDRPMREIDLVEQKLTHRLDQSGVIRVHNDKGTEILTLSPGMWDCVLHDIESHPD